MESLFICWSFYLVLLCTNPNVAVSDKFEVYKKCLTVVRTIATAGTNFMIGVNGAYGQLNSTNIHLHITTTDQTPAHVSVAVPFINFDNSYTVVNHTVIPLNGTLAQFEAGKQLKEVNSDVNISVTVVTGNGDLTEGYLALPVEAFGTRYVAASYYPIRPLSSEILVVGVEVNTDVTLSTMLNGHVNSSTTFRLQKFETFQFKSNNDVTGSLVMSKKPVAVFSGSEASKIPIGVGDWQFLIPVKYWATKYIIPPIYPRQHFTVKIIADSNGTEVQIFNSTRHFAVYLNERSVEEVLLGNDALIVTFTKPVSVVKYGNDGDNMMGDPYMSNAQGLSYFRTSYRFVTQNYYSKTSTTSNTIAITIRKVDVSGLRLNGQPLSYWNAVNISVPEPMEEYVTMFVNVSYNSYYRLYHTGGVQFGAILYGRIGSTIAYGYPLQMTFTNPVISQPSPAQPSPDHPINVGVSTVHGARFKYCTFSLRVLLSVYQIKSSSIPQSSPSPTSSLTTLAASNHSFEKGNGTMCFHCDGMTSLKYCDQIQRCKQENEVVIVQMSPVVTNKLTVVSSGHKQADRGLQWSQTN